MLPVKDELRLKSWTAYWPPLLTRAAETRIGALPGVWTDPVPVAAPPRQLHEPMLWNVMSTVAPPDGRPTQLPLAPRVKSNAGPSRVNKPLRV
jgi:hypothetical protein